jgi:O-antigen/teichoic acid export membrane protein
MVKARVMKPHGVKVNFIFNMTGPIAALVVALVTVPIYVSYIGAARYGVLSIVWVLLGYFGFLDLGLSRASANALAKHGHLQKEERSKILITAFSINLCLGILAGIILYFAGRFLLEHLLAVSAELKPEIETVFPWISCLVPLALISGVASGALEARERFLVTNMLQAVGSAVGQVLPVICAVFISPSLSVVIPAAALSRFLGVLLIVGFVIREEWPMSLRSFDRKRATTLLTYGGWISVTNILSPVIVSLDQLVIGSVLGLASVTYYVVPMSIVTRSQLFAAALAATLFPRMSRLRDGEVRELTQSAMLTLAYIYGAICASAIVLSRPFIEVWMGQDFASIAAPVAETLFIGAWINGLAFIPFAHLQGQGRPDIISKYLMVELLPFCFVLWLLTKELGIIGSAYAWVIRTPVHLIFFLTVLRFPSSQYIFLILPFFFIVTSFIFVQFYRPAPIEAVVAASVFGLGVAVLGLIFDQNLRHFLLSFRAPKRSQRIL